MKRQLLLLAALGLAVLAFPLVGWTQDKDAGATPPPAGTVRYIVGGDSRNDHKKVLPWSFEQAKARGAKGFLFLGDMTLTPQLDSHFKKELRELEPLAFFPVIGNHEIKQLGVIRISFIEKLTGYNPEKKFRQRFLGTKQTPAQSAFGDKIVYGQDLEGGLHFVALDNVSQKGFGAQQLKWLEGDLLAARRNPATKFIVVGMHKALAKNGVTTHAMDEDGDGAIRDSDAALALFQKYGVAMVFESHQHAYARHVTGGIECHLTGGLGAPIPRKLQKEHPEQAFHHFIQLDVSAGGLKATVVKFPGEAHVREAEDDDSADEAPAKK